MLVHVSPVSLVSESLLIWTLDLLQCRILLENTFVLTAGKLQVLGGDDDCRELSGRDISLVVRIVSGLVSVSLIQYSSQAFRKIQQFRPERKSRGL